MIQVPKGGVAMAASQISLQPEIMREDVWRLVDWLRNDEVRRFLSDTQDVSSQLMQLLDRVNLPVMTHLFNQDGRFFMVNNQQGQAVGFVRLLIEADCTEIVLVIGERSRWGQSLGSQTLTEVLKFVFYELRSPRLIAWIKRSNVRSLRAFARMGFKPHRESEDSFCLSLTLDAYLAQAAQKKYAAKAVVMTEIDWNRLGRWISQHLRDQTDLNWAAQGLRHELKKAKIMDSTRFPEDVLSMRTRAHLAVNGQPMTVSLVYPHEACWPQKQLSVLSPIGTAVLGYREGDRINWPAPTGFLDIEIKKLLYQPEAFGHFSQ
ncbi:MAG: GNAT family N-acetyltransferase [Eubacteriales bacterium]|nr:GNAT family N-acetyltransferase [Eubacteriales bacterium]